MENIGKEGPTTVHGTVHYGLEWPMHQYSEAGITLSSSSTGYMNETFHTYSVERQKGVIRWFIDDVEYSSITKEEMRPYPWPFDEDFYFILNLAVGGRWPGNVSDDTVFPQQLEVDYVRVYEDVFPKVVGKTVVDCLEKQVQYKVTNVEATNLLYTWSIVVNTTTTQHATIKSGQGTDTIFVDFDSIMEGSTTIDSAIIRVQATNLDIRSTNSSIGLAKLSNGIGLRVKIVDFDGKCASDGLQKFNFDCGYPSKCTQFVLNKITDTDYSCGERISWLMHEMGMDEKDACIEVGYKQFHGHCGPCNPNHH